jgi:hypothetical protein
MKVLALVVGIALVAIGVAGFVPQLMESGMLFGVMPMDPLRNILFIATGAIGVMIGLTRRRELDAPRGTGRDLRDFS